MCIDSQQRGGGGGGEEWKRWKILYASRGAKWVFPTRVFAKAVLIFHPVKHLLAAAWKAARCYIRFSLSLSKGNGARFFNARKSPFRYKFRWIEIFFNDGAIVRLWMKWHGPALGINLFYTIRIFSFVPGTPFENCHALIVVSLKSSNKGRGDVRGVS